MKSKCIVITLTLLTLTLFVYNIAFAGPDQTGTLEAKKEQANSAKDNTDTEADKLIYAHILYSAMKGQYDANQAAIKRGQSVLVGNILSASVSVALTGGVTTNMVISGVVNLLGLSDSINASTEILSAYETAIYTKQGQIGTLESYISTYNSKYANYLAELVSHTGVAESEPEAPRDQVCPYPAPTCPYRADTAPKP